VSETITVQLAQRGVIVLPKSLRDSYNLKPGDSITIIDLDGVLVLSPRRSKIDALANDIARSLTQRGETLESMLAALREERERRSVPES
jgi:AbrB family looped-hinge helix DNA binding protein